MAILDTDLLVAYLRRKDFGLEIIHRLRDKQTSLKTTVFNSAELYKGCYSMKNVAKGLMKVKKLIASMAEVLIFDEIAIQEYAKISADLKQRGETIGVFDELIGSICIANSEPLYTHNTRHFQKIRDLDVIDWSNL